MSKTIQMFGFPSNISVEGIKEFLEQHTGNGTVYALKIEQRSKEGDPKTSVKVQFTSNRIVEKILLLVTQKLCYSNEYLNATEMKSDIVAKPKIFPHSMHDTAVHFGCQISKENFSVLWKHPNALVKFGSKLRKMYIFFNYLSADYKLEIFSESIRKIELHSPHGQAKKLLHFQLLGAPRIYTREMSKIHYFKEAHDGMWFRTLDFSPKCCIGQSSALCLELLQMVKIPHFHGHFDSYQEHDSYFNLEMGSSFSCNSNLVPMVTPPEGFDLPYKILFKVNSLVQHGVLLGPTIDISFFQLVDPHRIKLEYIESALDKLYHMKVCCFEPARWLEKEYEKYSTSSEFHIPPAISLDNELVYLHRAQITPTKIYFCGPEVNLSNRVLRNFPQDIDNFLRVSFVDEDLDKLHSTDMFPLPSSTDAERVLTKLHERVLDILQNGISIGTKKFEFLAFSPSQLRDNSLWMFASRDGLTASDIRNWMGDFQEIRNVAKYAARLGQSFSSSRKTLSVSKHEIENIPDIKVKKGEITYCFSDGIGKISAELAQNVARLCGCGGSVPSAFQIRYGGYKGVVAIDPTSSKKLSLRNSMCKYKSETITLDVLAWSKYKPCFLNRQVITLLSTLGVKDKVFLRKQREIVKKLKKNVRDPMRAQEALDFMFSGEITNVVKEMLIFGYKPNKEPFLSMILQTLLASKLQELRLRTRIFVQKGRALMGCLDETRTLEYGQVFVQISNPKNKLLHGISSLAFNGIVTKKSKYIVKGKIVVTKNPCLHPGDIRVLRAVDVPALHHMVDCVVFPQKGKRPHSNECSGSDLDGDIYFVCWDPDLIPPRQEKPMDNAPSRSTNQDHDVKLQEVKEFFADYIVKDNLGIIASAHTVFADRDPQKAMSPSCMELAKLHSTAVDFAKSGVPADIPSHLRVEQYPDFMEKPNKISYKSKSIIGKLYREVRDVALQMSPIKSFTREVARKLYDFDMEIAGFEKYITDAYKYKRMYDYKLGNLMDYYGIKTEAEIVSGNILEWSKSFDERKDLEGINFAVRSLRKEARTWFSDMIRNSSSKSDDTHAIASAWYYVTYHHSYWGCYNEGLNRHHFLSFPWCIHEKLIQIKRLKANCRTQGLKLWAMLRHLPIFLFCFLFWIIIVLNFNDS